MKSKDIPFLNVYTFKRDKTDETKINRIARRNRQTMIGISILFSIIEDKRKKVSKEMRDLNHCNYQFDIYRTLSNNN